MARVTGTAKTRAWERIALGSAAGIALAASFVIVRDLSLVSSGETTQQGESLATITKTKNQVLRRTVDSPLWRSADHEDSLFNNDQVFTGDLATSRVTFADGTIIELEPNTLVRIEQKPQSSTINIERGSVVANLTSSAKRSVDIAVHGKFVRLKPSDAAVHFANNGNDLSVTVQRGRTDVIIGKKTIKLGPKEVIDFTPGAEAAPVARKLSVELKTPAAGQRVVSGSRETIPFTWKILGASTPPLKWQICRDRSCSDIVEQRIAPEPSLNWTPPIETGQLFWRVVAVGPNGDVPASSWRSIEVISRSRMPTESTTSKPIALAPPPTPAPQPVAAPAPAQAPAPMGLTDGQENAIAEETKPTKPATLAVAKPQYAPVQPRPVPVKPPPPVEKKPEPKPVTQPPKALAAKKITIKEITDVVLTPESKIVNKKRQFKMTYSWTKIPEVPEYTFVLAGDPKFKDVITKQVTFDGKITIDMPPRGFLYWRVVGRTDDVAYVAKGQLLGGD